MKRSCDDMDMEIQENTMLTEDLEQPTKKWCEEKNEAGGSVEKIEYRAFEIQGKPMLVERNIQPDGIPLVNPKAVGRKTYQETMELEDSFSNAALLMGTNAKNKIDVIGQQMKYLQESLIKVVNKTKQDSELHTAACNFVKVPGKTYHLYERPSGQKYFSMLSPQEWRITPHKFLGSWFLEADQSWTPAEEMHLRYQGVAFLKQMYAERKAVM